ncbi:hypothetical protein [Bosea sp. NBC_00550]|uniref:hypothetical protein n=1 Tax=Bosea sp. NBC_00550 TaxID=2969621 RepID=UPI00222EA9A4|nr:hypothetical protein [Bosea sp. NBC_00550]UZF94448.1 hypothetical protein NWE53_09835 [Bosea sp. NBC_00550]
MMRAFALAATAGLVAFATAPAIALPKIESSTRANGVVAFQDEADPKQFHIYPERIPLVLGLTLSDPSVKYWGIGAPFRQKDPEYGLYVPIVGATISGLATVTITPDQETAIRAAIKRDFEVDTPKLANLDGKTKSIEPVYAATSLGIKGNGDSVFPPAFRFGSSFNFVVGSPDSHTFASYVAQRIRDQPDITPDSSFGVNLVATSQFRGAPWSVSCKADLQKVWKEVRQRYNGSGGYGWFGMTADYQSIQQDLFRSKLIDCDLKEGDLEAKEKGAQLFQIAKDALTSINDPDNEFFRFQPNPQAAANGGAAQGPWLVSLNLAYSSASLKVKIEWKQTFTFNPTVERDMPVSLTLAVKCDVNTEQYFKELEVSEPCITAKKAKFIKEWTSRENELKQAKLIEVMSNPNLSDKQKKDLVKFYSKISLSDSAMKVAASGLSSKDSASILKTAPTSEYFIGLSDDFFEQLERLVARGSSVKDAVKALSK